MVCNTETGMWEITPHKSAYRLWSRSKASRQRIRSRCAFTVTDLVKLPTTRFLDNLWGDGLADRLLLRITYGMAMCQQ